jgi:drug/metabolite transporter (DMT)-like permease
VGILILVRPGGAIFHPAILLLLGAALSNALYQLLTRKLPGDASHTTLFYSGLVGTVLLTLALPFVETPPTIRGSDVFFLVVLGLLAGVGHWNLIVAFTRAPATLVAPFTYVGMVWATLYGLALFGHFPDRWSFLGMAVIVSSGVWLMAHERRAHRL